MTEETSFDKINRCSVAIQSLRNQLKLSQNLDELTIIAGKIIDLENEILSERTAGCKKLAKKKKEIEIKIDGLRRKISNEETKLSTIDNMITLKISKYKEQLENKIEDLSKEYNSIVSMCDVTPKASTVRKKRRKRKTYNLNTV